MRGDLEWGSVGRLVQSAGERFGDAEAVVDGDRRVSFAELAQLVRAHARAVVASGVAAGDRVAIWAPNSLDWAVAALGAVSAGAALVPINTRFKSAEAGYVLHRSGARLVFTGAPFLGIDFAALVRDANVPGVEVVPRGDPAFTERGADVSDHAVEDRLAAVRPADLSDVIFTSGTTGHPKGVMTTHAQSLRVFEVWSDLVGLAEGDRYLVINPFFHTFGYKAGILACLMRGATIVPLPAFDVDAAVAAIQAEQITVLPGPPTLYQSMLDRGVAAADVPSLRLAVTGAAVVPVELVRRMSRDLGFDTVLTAYGLTEATGTVTMCRHGDDAETIATTSGRAIPDTEVRVVDEKGEPLPPGEPGEVVTRGYHVMQGYFEDPTATAEAMDADGWLRTGDIGVLDAQGNLRVTDRIKDMYVVGGFNAYPAEIELVLAGHPDVAEAAVVGVPDARLGEVGRAFVVPAPDAKPDADTLVAWCRERLANFKVPRSVEVVDVLPRNASGKVLKFELRERP